jgi:hypothetical protein
MSDPAKPVEALQKALKKSSDDYHAKVANYKKAFAQVLASKHPAHADKVAVLAEKTRVELATTLTNLATLPDFINKAKEAISKSLKTLKTANENYE